MRMKVLSIAFAVSLLITGIPVAQSYQEVEVKNGGIIAGEVKLTGKAESLAPLKVTKDNNHCGSQKPNEELIVSDGGGVKNAVVMIEKIDSGKKISKDESSIANQNCQYIPHVQAMVAGSTLKIVNADPILHNTHGYLNKTDTVFNLALPLKDQTIPKKVKKPGIINVACDAGHTWMNAYVVVTENPYFAVTDQKGAFEIKDVPPGKYQLKAWHERLGTQVAEVMVSEKGTAKVVFDKLAK